MIDEKGLTALLAVEELFLPSNSAEMQQFQSARQS
jgi:hypothetical protein